MQKHISCSLAFLAIGALSLTGCSELESAMGTEKTYQIEATSVEVEEAMKAPVDKAVIAESKKALANLDQIKSISKELPMSNYSRDRFIHWENVNYLKKNIEGSASDWAGIKVPKSCDARSALLIERSETKPDYRESTCSVKSGSWLDTYGNWDFNSESVSGLGQIIKDPSKIDIDHIIPLAGSWRLGSSKWTDEKRTRFANDPLNLITSEASANRSKGDKLIDQWAPYSPNYACDYSNKYVEISIKYDLPATESIRDTLKTYLNRCVTEKSPNFWEL